MLLKFSTSSRLLRACVLGLATLSTAIVFTTDTADARRHKKQVRSSYSPAFASIIVDANSGAILSSNNPDALRHPASLTKIMTLYMLFERLESGRMTLDTEMPVSAHAASQSPTKLGVRPGQTLRVEDAIKALVTRSANDAAVVIAEALAGDEASFARAMTRKARALGMSKTTYRNASGLPDSAQITSARDQATLGRAVQDRFPRYYRFFSTHTFVYRGRQIRNHNKLLGSVEGIDGIKTGYTRASGFNLVSNIKRGNRHLVGVVLGGRSGGARDATMRNLLAENLNKGASRRTVAAITENNAAANIDIAQSNTPERAPRTIVEQTPAVAPLPVAAPVRPAERTVVAAALPVPAPSPRPEPPAPLTNGVIQTESMSAIPGGNEPMKPVRIRTVQVRSGQVQVASNGPVPTPATPTPVPPSRVAETSSAAVARAEMPPQPSNHGTGQGVLGVLPASALNRHAQQMASMDTNPLPPTSAPATTAQTVAKSHSGWIIQVGALDSESRARDRLEEARSSARGLLGKADPFTEEAVSRGDRKVYRARFAGLERQQAETICKTLKRAEISCFTIKN